MIEDEDTAAVLAMQRIVSARYRLGLRERVCIDKAKTLLVSTYLVVHGTPGSPLSLAEARRLVREASGDWLVSRPGYVADGVRHWLTRVRGVQVWIETRPLTPLAELKAAA